MSPLDSDLEGVNKLSQYFPRADKIYCPPLDVCDKRDVQRSGKLARACEMKKHDGILLLCEDPHHPALVVDTSVVFL